MLGIQGLLYYIVRIKNSLSSVSLSFSVDSYYYYGGGAKKIT